MLVITPNLTKPDETYAGLIAAHAGLSEERPCAECPADPDLDEPYRRCGRLGRSRGSRPAA